MIDARLRWLKKISIKVHNEDTKLLARLQPLLKSAQADLIPAPRLPDLTEQDDGENYYDQAMGGSLYDEDGRDLMALDSHTSVTQEESFTPSDTVINDNCTPLGLAIYADYGIANVALSEHWRVYPNDENLLKLKTMISEDNLHFHYN